MEERPIKIEKTRARQAVTGMGVRYVLGMGLLLVLSAFVVIYLVFYFFY